MKNLIITFIIIVIASSNLYSQNKIIKGRVISDDFETVSSASIRINDTVEVGKTDTNGFFQIDIHDSVNKLLFNSVGMETTKIVFRDHCDQVAVVMIFRSSDDFLTLKKVDKHRLKRFKKLPKLYKEAFAKGLFKTDRACYTQEFIPYYKKKQK